MLMIMLIMKMELNMMMIFVLEVFGTTPGGPALMSMERQCTGACTGWRRNITKKVFSKIFYSGTCGPMDPRNVWSSLITPLRSTLASLSPLFHQGKGKHYNPYLVGCLTR